MDYGTSNYDQGNFTSVKHHKIMGSKDGSQVSTIFRIVPPILQQREHGRIVIYEPVHWGYFGVSSKDPTKTFPRTFICPREMNFRTKEIITPCDECSMIEELDKEREGICPTRNVKREVRQVAFAKLSPADQQRVRLLDDILDGRENGAGSHKIDNKRWKLNVVMYDGVAGDIKLSSSVWYQIKARRGTEQTNPGLVDKSLARADGWDPIAPHQGRWIRVVRTGSGFGTPDKVDFLKATEKLGDEEVEVPVKAPITEAMDRAITQGCRDLSDCAPSVRLTSSQVGSLVHLFKQGTNDPRAVDEVFDIKPEPARGTLVAVPETFRPDEEGDDEVPAFEQPAAASPPVNPAPVRAVQPAPVAAAAPAPAKPVTSASVPAATPPAAPASGKVTLTPEIQAFLEKYPDLAKQVKG